MTIRTHIVIDILLLVTLLTLPWWIFVPLALIALIFIDFYIEIVFFGFLFDLLYGVHHTGLYLSVASLLLILGIKPLIRV